jgi:hypothetical protein
MFIRKTALCIVLGLAINGSVLADEDVSEGVIIEPGEQQTLVEVPTGPLDETVDIINEPKQDDSVISEEDRVIQTALPTAIGGIESQSGMAESLNDFTGHPDLQDLDQDEVLALDNLASGSSKGLLKLKKAGK